MGSSRSDLWKFRIKSKVRLMKKYICIIAFCLAGTLLVANDELAAHYNFSEGAGKLLKDQSGNGLNCKVLNGEWVKTEYGSAIKFKGKKVGARGSSSSMLNMGKGSFTICVFLKIPKSSKSFRILEKGAGNGSNGYRFYFREKLGMIMGPAKPVHYMLARGDGGFRNLSVNDGEWHFVSCIFDRKNDMQLYVDGEPSGKAKDIRDLKGLEVTSNAGFLIYMGMDSKSSCVISDIAIYRKALTKLQIKEKHAVILQKKFSKK
jgi:concanavalin A-like lectin/glucanase superfamily protein